VTEKWLSGDAERCKLSVRFEWGDGDVAYMKKEKVFTKDAWDAGTPGMWSVFKDYPPTSAEQSQLPKP